MNRLVRKEFVLALGSCLIAMLIAGCEQQNLPTAKKNRLIAYENKPLKEQLAQQEKKIEEQNRLLGECQQRREVLEKRLEKEVNAKVEEEVSDRISKAMGIFAQANEQMEQENNKLKAQVEELQAQLRKLQQQLK